MKFFSLTTPLDEGMLKMHIFILMGVGIMASIAEYLGQRTDIDTVQIQPARIGDLCPFMGGKACSKLTIRGKPFCAVRDSYGKLWIACEHRLCSTSKTYQVGGRRLPLPLNDYQRDKLLNVAQTIFSPTVGLADVAFKREVSLRATVSVDYKADYVMTIMNGTSPYPGPDRLVVEMQGGGETSNTKSLTNIVTEWEQNPNRTNQQLRRPVDKVGTLETNAWRRQQEQFIVKGNVAMLSWKGYGIAFCVGTLLYNYVMDKIRYPNELLPDLRNNNWTLALIEFCEDDSNPPQSGPIPLQIGRTRFTNYQTFVQALINQGEPSLETFRGTFETLAGTTVNIP